MNSNEFYSKTNAEIKAFRIATGRKAKFIVLGRKELANLIELWDGYVEPYDGQPVWD
jgi:hypothetical protein